jgi:hypothetical protein
MILAALLLISAPEATGNSVEPPAKPQEKLICRMEYEAYSRIPKRVCGTQAEWDQMYKETQEDLGNSRNDRHVAPNGAL